jgi:hypothetical protein
MARKTKECVKQELPGVERAPGCAHHWVIESPGGPTSRAMCKRCGSVTEFSNYVHHQLPSDRRLKRSEMSSLADDLSKEDADGELGERPGGG